jgi:hypothetical protein
MSCWVERKDSDADADVLLQERGSNAFGVGVPAPVDYDDASHVVVKPTPALLIRPKHDGEHDCFRDALLGRDRDAGLGL